MRLSEEQLAFCLKRQRDMRRMRKNRYTLQAIGDKYGVTRERVRQILLKTYKG